MERINQNKNFGDIFDYHQQCMICETKQRRFISSIGRNFHQLDTVICTGCGLVHSNPIPTNEDLKKFYKKKYRWFYKLSNKPSLKHILRYAEGALERVNFIKKYINSNQKKLLDVGAGSGEFIFMAKKSGFEVSGLEPHVGYFEFVNQDLGIQVQNCTLEDAKLEKESFDIINLSQVLEHLQNPFATLKNLHQVLRKDGIIQIDVPDLNLNFHAPWTRFHYAHIYNFNHKTLKALIEKSGYKILNPENQHTNIIAKKINYLENNHQDHLQKNYHYLWDHILQKDQISHYQSSRPYQRFLTKCIKYPKEIITALFYRSPKKILDHVYEKHMKSYKKKLGALLGLLSVSDFVLISDL